MENKNIKFISGKLWRKCMDNIIYNNPNVNFEYNFDTYCSPEKVKESKNPVLVRMLKDNTPNDIAKNIVNFYKDLGKLIEDKRNFIPDCQTSYCEDGHYSCSCGKKTNMNKFKIQKTKKWLYCPQCNQYIVSDNDYNHYKKMENKLNLMMNHGVRWSKYKDYYLVYPKKNFEIDST